MTRQEALDKVISHLGDAEGSMGDQHLGKHLSLAQLYLGLARELSIPSLDGDLLPQWEKDLMEGKIPAIADQEAENQE